HHGADRVALKVQCQTEYIVGKFEHFALHHVGQTVDAANTVGHGNDRALCANVGRRTQAFNTRLQQFADLGRVKSHVQTPESCYLALSGGQRIAHAGQLGLHRSVKYLVTHDHAHTADQIRIDGNRWFELE